MVLPVVYLHLHQKQVTSMRLKAGMIYQTHLRPRRLLHELLLLPLLRYLLLRLFLLQLLGLLDNHHLLQVNQEVLDQFHLLVILRKHSQQRMFFHLRLKVSVVLPREQRFQLLQPFQLHQNPLLSRISMHLQLPRMLCNLHHQDLHLQR